MNIRKRLLKRVFSKNKKRAWKETWYLLSIPSMRKSIIDDMKSKDSVDKIDW
jgi:hypothetical protein